MDTTESLGYLKGLIEGLDLGDNKKETRFFLQSLTFFQILLRILTIDRRR